jgi:HD-like signal output (HDOD) protein
VQGTSAGSAEDVRWNRPVAKLQRELDRLRSLRCERLAGERVVTHAPRGRDLVHILLSLWGLPDGVVEAVAHHHDPGVVPGATLDAVAAVHIADALAHEVRQSGLPLTKLSRGAM